MTMNENNICQHCKQQISKDFPHVCIAQTCILSEDELLKILDAVTCRGEKPTIH